MGPGTTGLTDLQSPELPSTLIFSAGDISAKLTFEFGVDQTAPEVTEYPVLVLTQIGLSTILTPVHPPLLGVPSAYLQSTFTYAHNAWLGECAPAGVYYYMERTRLPCRLVRIPTKGSL